VELQPSQQLDVVLLLNQQLPNLLLENRHQKLNQKRKNQQVSGITKYLRLI